MRTPALGFQLAILAIALASLALMAFALVDAIRRPRAQWQAAGSSKALWIILIFIFGVLGALGYLIAIRPRLKSAAAS